MQEFNPSDLKTILHSKRANLYYLEHCRVLVKQGRVEYVTDAGKQSAYWNIPIANTTAIMLGTGTSITQMAMRKLAQAGGLVFDVADLIKDSLVLPQAFVSAMRGDSEQEFRQACLNAFANTEALDFMIDTVKAIAQTHGSCR